MFILLSGAFYYNVLAVKRNNGSKVTAYELVSGGR